MAIWAVKKVKTSNISGQENVIVKVSWEVTDTDDVNRAVCAKSTSLSYAPGDSFAPYSELAEAQVIGWVKDSLGPNGVAFYEKLLTTHLSLHRERFPEVKNADICCDGNYQPETSTALPWA